MNTNRHCCEDAVPLVHYTCVQYVGFAILASSGSKVTMGGKSNTHTHKHTENTFSTKRHRSVKAAVSHWTLQEECED